MATNKDIAHDRNLIEASFHSGIAPKETVEKFFRKYVKQNHRKRRE